MKVALVCALLLGVVALGCSADIERHADGDGGLEFAGDPDAEIVQLVLLPDASDTVAFGTYQLTNVTGAPLSVSEASLVESDDSTCSASASMYLFDTSVDGPRVGVVYPFDRKYSDRASLLVGETDVEPGGQIDTIIALHRAVDCGPGDTTIIDRVSVSYRENGAARALQMGLRIEVTWGPVDLDALPDPG